MEINDIGIWNGTGNCANDLGSMMQMKRFQHKAEAVIENKKWKIQTNHTIPSSKKTLSNSHELQKKNYIYDCSKKIQVENKRS